MYKLLFSNGDFMTRSNEVETTYRRAPSDAGDRRRHHLEGFARVTLELGERRTVEMTLPASAFAVYGEDGKSFVPSGAPQVFLGGGQPGFAQTAEAPTYYVGTELDKAADYVFMMLGMNDLLKPTTYDTPESLAQWKANLKTFTQNIRAREAFLAAAKDGEAWATLPSIYTARNGVVAFDAAQDGDLLIPAGDAGAAGFYRIVVGDRAPQD